MIVQRVSFNAEKKLIKTDQLALNTLNSVIEDFDQTPPPLPATPVVVEINKKLTDLKVNPIATNNNSSG